MDLAVGIGRIGAESSGRGGQDNFGEVVVTVSAITKCVLARVILICVSLILLKS